MAFDSKQILDYLSGTRGIARQSQVSLSELANEQVDLSSGLAKLNADYSHTRDTFGQYQQFSQGLRNELVNRRQDFVNFQSSIRDLSERDLSLRKEFAESKASIAFDQAQFKSEFGQQFLDLEERGLSNTRALEARINELQDENARNVAGRNTALSNLASDQARTQAEADQARVWFQRETSLANDEKSNIQRNLNNQMLRNEELKKQLIQGDVDSAEAHRALNTELQENLQRMLSVVGADSASLDVLLDTNKAISQAKAEFYNLQEQTFKAGAAMDMAQKQANARLTNFYASSSVTESSFARESVAVMENVARINTNQFINEQEYKQKLELHYQSQRNLERAKLGIERQIIGAKSARLGIDRQERSDRKSLLSAENTINKIKADNKVIAVDMKLQSKYRNYLSTLSSTIKSTLNNKLAAERAKRKFISRNLEISLDKTEALEKKSQQDFALGQENIEVKRAENRAALKIAERTKELNDWHANKAYNLGMDEATIKMNENLSRYNSNYRERVMKLNHDQTLRTLDMKQSKDSYLRGMADYRGKQRILNLKKAEAETIRDKEDRTRRDIENMRASMAEWIKERRKRENELFEANQQRLRDAQERLRNLNRPAPPTTPNTIQDYDPKTGKFKPYGSAGASA